MLFPFELPCASLLVALVFAVLAIGCCFTITIFLLYGKRSTILWAKLNFDENIDTGTSK